MLMKFWLSRGKLILCLILVIWIVSCCMGGPPKKVNTELVDSAEVKYGSIRGTVRGCDGELLRDARVDINSMPDSFVNAWFTAKSRTLYPAKYFDNAEYHDTVRTDSIGGLRFDNLPLGYYQLWFDLDMRLSKRDSCDRYQMSGSYSHNVDFVRVAPDSVSIVGFSAFSDPTVKFARTWDPIYEPLEH